MQIGDLHRGVPELRADSRYNTDTAVVTSKFSIGVDVLNVIAETKPQGCVDYGVMTTIDDFSWHMVNLPGVQSAVDLPGLAKTLNAGWNEGSPEVAGPGAEPVGADPVGDLRADVERAAERRLQRDARHAVHRAITRRETIEEIVAAVKRFEAGHGNPDVSFKLATGNVGVMAATNEAVAAAQWPIMALRLRGGRPAVPDLLQVGARHAVHPDPAGPRVDAVVRADGRRSRSG